MKRIYLIILLVLPLFASAQTLVVSDFYLDVKDQTANNEATKQIDDNGEVCALIRIETTQKGFSYDGGTIGIVMADESKAGEIWLYVPAGLSHITIRHPQLGTLRDYYFPEKLQPARTYVMKLISGTVSQVVQQELSSQWFVLNFEPNNAMVEIDGTITEGENGQLSRLLSRGSHEIRLSALNYHTEVAKVEIGAEKKVMSLKLKPAFGWIEIKGPNGASVFVDNNKIGQAPIKSNPIASGSHDLRVTMENWLPYREQVLVNDNTVTTVNPILTANFVSVNLSTEKDAEIWVNDVKKGVGNVSIDLPPGEYKFETKKTNHRTQTIVRNIDLFSGRTIDIPKPVAIIGAISVNVNPIGSIVYLDDNLIGESPLLIDDVLIGKHKIVIKKEGHADVNKQIDVREGEITTIEERLADTQNVKLSCGVSDAKWNVDGIDCGKGEEITVSLTYSEHNVKVHSDLYEDVSESFTVSPSTTNKTFSLHRRNLISIKVNGVTFNMRYH